ncbi:hypothetical protein TNCV_490811 [Trichonephila clavipes]|nr:hypothetical protein TNCV_490811 [Trichonephila clavipes]
MVERFNWTILNSFSLLVSSNHQDWDKKLPHFLLPTGVLFTRSPAISYPRCSSDVIFVYLQIFYSAVHQLYPWRLRSISRNYTGTDGGNASSSE